MKRLWILLGAGAFLLCIVTPLFAQPDIKTTGQIRVRYRDWNDFLMDNDLAANTTSGRNRHYFDIRTRFGVKAAIEPGLTGAIEIERYDDFGTHSLVNAGVSPSDATALGIPTGTGGVYFRQAWADWVIPGTPVHIAGGRMLPTYGGSIVLDGSTYGMDGVQTYGQWGPVTVSAFYWKPQNGDTPGTQDRRFANNDFDIYGGNIKYWLLPKNSIELYGFLSNDKTRAKTLSIANTPGICTGAPGDCADTSEYFIGLAFFGATQNDIFTYRLEGAYQGGIARKSVSPTAALGNAAGDIDRSAFMIAGGVGFGIIPGVVTLKLDAGYASGDDNVADNEFNNFASIYGLGQPTLMFQEGNPFGNTSSAQFGNNTTNRAYNVTTLGTADADLAFSTTDTGTRFSPGLLYFKPGVKWVPLKQVSITGDVGVMWAPSTPSSVDSFMGIEPDILISWQVYKNLVVNGYFGYLFTGDFFDSARAGVANNTDDPWFGRLEFILTF